VLQFSDYINLFEGVESFHVPLEKKSIVYTFIDIDSKFDGGGGITRF